MLRALADSVRNHVVDKVLNPVLSLVDGRLTIRGYHGDLAPARPETMATLLQNTRPPFSSAASNVKQHPSGVTSYDITPGLGPKFAYRIAAVSHFEVSGARFSLVELKIGDDPATKSKSDYEGRAYHIFGQGERRPWAAELWDDVKAKNGFADATATVGHNGIVDGLFGLNGFRGLAAAALKVDRKNRGAALEPIRELPAVAISEELLRFVADPAHVPGISAERRAAFLTALREHQSRQDSAVDGSGFARFAGDRPAHPAPAGGAPPGTVASGPLARFQLSADQG